MKSLIFLIVIGLAISGCIKENNVNDEVDNLILNLSHEEYNVRSDASNKLVKIGSVTPIINSLQKEAYYNISPNSFNARWNKVNVLGQIGSNKAEDVLIDRILNDEETHVRWRSIWALNIVKTVDAESKLINALKTDKKWRAAVALGSFKNNNSKHILLEGITNTDDWIKWEAVYVLGILGDSSTALPISKLLNDKSERIRQETALTLGKLSNKEIIPNLIQSLQDESPGVRWRAASSLAKLKNKSVIPNIEKALEKETDKDTFNYINKSLENLKRI